MLLSLSRETPRPMFEAANTGEMAIRKGMIVFFIVSVNLKYLALLADIETGEVYFYATSAIGIIVPIFFMIFNENDKRVYYSFKNKIPE